MVKIKSREDNQEESLYLGTAESEHIEMYLKAIWYIRETGDEVKVSICSPTVECDTTFCCPDAQKAR